MKRSGLGRRVATAAVLAAGVVGSGCVQDPEAAAAARAERLVAEEARREAEEADRKREQYQAAVVRAARGEAVAQVVLGWMLDNGEGVAENDVEAVRWYRAAAEQGNAHAQNSLAVAFARGEGVGKMMRRRGGGTTRLLSRGMGWEPATSGGRS